MSWIGWNINRSRESLCLLLPLVVSGVMAGNARSAWLIENQGQLPEPVRYYAPCDGGTLYFTTTGVVLVLTELEQSVPMRFNTPREALALEPRDRSDLRLSFFHGNDPARWRSNVPVYESLVYRDLWPGVDLTLRPMSGGVRYAFSKPPPLAPQELPFTFEGCSRTTRDQNGTLKIEIAGAVLTDRPATPDDPAGSERILSWAGSDQPDLDPVQGPGTMTRTGTLAFDWGTFLGGVDLDRAHGVNLDSEERPIVIGFTRSPEFPLGQGGWDVSHNGGYDVFIIKMDQAGSRVLWGTFIGGSGEDRPMDVKFDSVGNILVGGTTASPNFPTTPGAWDRTLGGNRDGFVAKFNPECTQLLWSTYLGGTAMQNNEFVWNIEMTRADEPVVCGRTDSADFPTTPDAYDPSYGGGSLDGYVTRLSANGSALIWSTFIGGTATDEVFDFVLDDEEGPILAVMTSTAGMYTSPDAYDSSFSGMRDFMITRLSSDGRTVGYSTYFGGPGDEGEARIARDSWGHVLLAGYTSSATDIAVGDVYDGTYNGGREAFVGRFDAWGTSAPLWCTYLGGSGNDVGEDVLFDALGNTFLAGYAAAGFPVTPSAFQPLFGGGDSDGFVARLDSQGKTLLYSTFVGGSDHDELWDSVQDSTGHTYVSGLTGSWDFPTTPGAYDETFNSPPGGRDAVLVRFTTVNIGAGVEPHDASLDLRSRAAPNPSGGPVQIAYRLSTAGGVTVEIFDASGSLVRRLAMGRQAAGSHDVVWDGRDEAGNRLPDGLYFTRVETAGGTIAGKVALVR